MFTSGLPPASRFSRGAVFSPTVDIRDYGARGDGVNDDLSLISLAIADAWKEAGVLFLPPGIFTGPANISMPTGYQETAGNNVTSAMMIQGAGRITPYGGQYTEYRNRGTILLQADTSGADFITAGTTQNMPIAGLMQPIYGLRDLTVLGPDINKAFPLANPVSGSGIRIGNSWVNVFVPQPIIDNVYIAGFRGLKPQTAAIAGGSTNLSIPLTGGRPALPPRRDMLVTLTGGTATEVIAVRSVTSAGAIIPWSATLYTDHTHANWNDPCAGLWLTNCEDGYLGNPVVQECACNYRFDNSSNDLSMVNARSELSDYFGWFVEGTCKSHFIAQPTIQSNYGVAVFADDFQCADFMVPHAENNQKGNPCRSLNVVPATGQKVVVVADTANPWLIAGANLTLIGCQPGTAEVTEIVHVVSAVDDGVNTTLTLGANVAVAGHTGIADNAYGISPYTWVFDSQSGVVARIGLEKLHGVGKAARISMTGQSLIRGADIWHEQHRLTSPPVAPSYYIDEYQDTVNLRGCNPGQIADGSAVQVYHAAVMGVVIVDQNGTLAGRQVALLNLGAVAGPQVVPEGWEAIELSIAANVTLTLPVKKPIWLAIKVTRTVANAALTLAAPDGTPIHFPGGTLIQSAGANTYDWLDCFCDNTNWDINTRGLTYS